MPTGTALAQNWQPARQPAYNLAQQQYAQRAYVAPPAAQPQVFAQPNQRVAQQVYTQPAAQQYQVNYVQRPAPQASLPVPVGYPFSAVGY